MNDHIYYLVHGPNDTIVLVMTDFYGKELSRRTLGGN